MEHEKKQPFCCEINCTKDATWEITIGNLPEDFTHSCDEHIAELIPDECTEIQMHRIGIAK